MKKRNLFLFLHTSSLMGCHVGFLAVIIALDCYIGIFNFMYALFTTYFRQTSAAEKQCLLVLRVF